MNTISLVTYHYSANVGAVMQTYALCRFLKENGFKIEVYDITQEQADTMSYELAKTFNQECVVQTQFNTDSKFVLLQR